METLQELLKKALADTFALYIKAQAYHWNVEGPLFAQAHDFLGDLYTELHGSVDPMAEQIRTLDVFAPTSMTRFLEMTDIECENSVPDFREMCRRLESDNTKVLRTLNVTFDLADNFKKQGIADFIAGRIDAHEKHGWMLRSFLK
jgi:starvation-inducible DNA-binding protein